MGRVFPTKYLTWREPAAARRARMEIERRRVPWLGRLLNVVFICAAFFSIWVLSRLLTPGRPPPFHVVAAVTVPFALFWVYVWPLLLRLLPCDIQITDRGIFVPDRWPPVWYKYRCIERCEIAVEMIRGEPVTVLAVHTMHRGTVLLGVDPSVSLEELEKVLRDRGVPVHRAG